MAGNTREPTPFGKALREIREEKGWTQEELGERVGIRSEQVSHYETGHRAWPSVPTLLNVADRVPVSILALLGRSPAR